MSDVVTLLDAAHAAVSADPENETLRLRFFERLADGDGPAVDVGARTIEPEFLLDGHVLRAERLVHLDQVHLVEGEPRLGERLARGWCRADAHVLGLHPGNPPRHQATDRLQALGRALAGQPLQSGQQHARESGPQQMGGCLEPAGLAGRTDHALIGVLADGRAARVDEQRRGLRGTTSAACAL